MGACGRSNGSVLISPFGGSAPTLPKIECAQGGSRSIESAAFERDRAMLCVWNGCRPPAQPTLDRDLGIARPSVGSGMRTSFAAFALPIVRRVPP